jgi:hypothetical protein
LGKKNRDEKQNKKKNQKELRKRRKKKDEKHPPCKKITRTKRNRNNCFCPSFNPACSICGPIYPSMKVVLFCFVVIRSTELGCFRSCNWCLWKALNEEGCMGLVP